MTNDDIRIVREALCDLIWALFDSGALNYNQAVKLQNAILAAVLAAIEGRA